MAANQIDVRCFRDQTRGGMASALNEFASTRGLGRESQRLRFAEVTRGLAKFIALIRYT
jgi:hydrogenase maturation factor